MFTGIFSERLKNCIRSRLLVGGFLAVACLTFALPAWGGNAISAPTRYDGLTADDLVREALTAELDGRSRDRDYWAEEAIKLAPARPTVRWLDGQVSVSGRWVKIEQAPGLVGRDQDYQRYLHLRSMFSDTGEGQYQLGVWCEKLRLKEQARAHFTRAVQLDPDHAAASRLGFTRIAGQWQSAAKLRQIESLRKKLQTDYENWKPKVDRIWQALERKDTGARQQALAELQAIDTLAAVPALALRLGVRGDEAGILAAETIGRIPGPETSLWLARLAAVSNGEKVRSRAVKELKARPLVEFVPAMLAEMQSPVEVSTEREYLPDGTAVVRLTMRRETQVAVEEAVSETTFWADSASPGAPVASWQNQIRTRGNSRIADVLNAVTDQHLSSDAKAWWSWWDDYNEVRRDPKPVVPPSPPELDPTTSPGAMLVQSESPYLPYLHTSCFAAGTPVWTVEGPRPVERIAIGDLVLSQNVETGELAYKPVLRTTIGQPVELVAVKLGEDTIQCTGGHAFWVPGSGWTHARKLGEERCVHGLAGAAEIHAVGPGPTVKTYNLVVADWNTYFVGHGKLLVHDITLPGPTTTVVPGLKTW